MNHPNDLSYSKSHEWVKMDGDTAIIGISDFAQDALGDVVFVNLPAEGDDVTAAEVRQGRIRPDLPRYRQGCSHKRRAAGFPRTAQFRSLRRMDNQGRGHHRQGRAAGRGGIRRVLRTGGLNNGQLRSIYRGGTQRDAQGHRSYGLPGALPRCA